jgi:predicted metal-dependent phosphoesterase TrpH
MKASPFTSLGRQIAFLRDGGRADLHLHTIHSDGTHTPESLVQRALQAGLKAIAVTDHDTLAGIVPAQRAAGSQIEIISGVEITCEHNGQELHLLAYLFDDQHLALNQALCYIREGRRRRILHMAERLRALNVSVVEEVERWPVEVSLGRRHLARLLIDRGHARSLHHAFTYYLKHAAKEVPKTRLPVTEAIALVRQAGGVTSWAHPSSETTIDDLRPLANMGLQAVECVYPWPSNAIGKRLRVLAEGLGLAITGGSDSHDPGPAARSVGAKTITLPELAKIKALAKFEAKKN